MKACFEFESKLSLVALTLFHAKSPFLRKPEVSQLLVIFGLAMPWTGSSACISQDRLSGSEVYTLQVSILHKHLLKANQSHGPHELAFRKLVSVIPVYRTKVLRSGLFCSGLEISAFYPILATENLSDITNRTLLELYQSLPLTVFRWIVSSS